MFEKILVYENALASQHPALQRALQLASYNDVELKVVDVVNDPSAQQDRHRPMRSVVEQLRKDRLDELCAPLRDRDIPYTTELIRGRPFVEIVREVVHEGFHLVIKTASSAQLNEVLGVMGPVDMRLVRNCPCPIWLEVPGGEVSCRKILVAIDPQTEDDDLNNVLLETAKSLAKASGGQLHVLSTWEVLDEEFLAQEMKPDNLAHYKDDVEMAARDKLDALLVAAGKPAGPNSVHFLKREPANAILEFVDSQNPDIVIMGTVGNTSVRGLLIGDTADTVLRRIDCPVLAIKPDSLFRV